MKLAEFFRQANETIDFTLALLEQPAEPSETNPVRLLCVQHEEKLLRLTHLFSADPQPQHLRHYAVHTAHYLNLLIMDVTAAPTETKADRLNLGHQQEPQPQEPATTPNKADFFFLPIDPITVIHNPECSPQLMTQYLGYIKTELQNRQLNLLTGWQVHRSSSGLYFCNSASSIDWHIFLTCVTDPDSESDKTDIVFEGQAEDSASIICRITAEKYLQLHHKHGVSLLDNDTRYLSALKKVLDENQHDYLQKHRSFLLTQLQSRSPSELALYSESIARSGKASASNGSVAFYDTLDTISFIFLQTKKLLGQVPAMTCQKTASAITEKKKSIVVSVDDLRTHFDEKSRQLFIDCVTELLSLLKTVQTLPALKEPYRHEDETLISEILLNLNTVLNIIHSLKILITKTENHSKQIKMCVQWLQESALIVLYDVIESFFQCRYHSAIIQLSCSAIEFLELLKSKSDETSAHIINQLIYRFKDNLINSLLNTGQYSFLLHWLTYFSRLTPAIYNKENYNFHLQQASDQNYLALVHEHRFNYTASRHHLDKAWECILRILNPAYLPSGVDSDSYYECSKATTESVALCYRALGTEEFEDRNFLVARSLFEAGQEYKVFEIIVKLKNIALLPQGKAVSTKVSAPRKELSIDDTRVNAHWCTLFNFLSIRRWLSKNVKKPCTLLSENGNLILRTSRKNVLNTLSRHLSEKKVPHRTKPKEIIFEEFATMELRAIEEAFSGCYGQSNSDSVKENASTQQPRPGLPSSAALENPASEELELFNLKSMHYKSIHHYDDAYFHLVAESLEAYHLRCRDPLLKLRALRILVSSLLARSLFLMTMEESSDKAASILRKAKEFTAAGRQFSVEQFSSEKQLSNPEVIETLDTLDARIVDHETLLSEYLPMHDLVMAQTILSALHDAVKQQPEYSHSIRLGAKNILENYNKISMLRNKLLKKTLCLRNETYKKRVEFIRQLTLFSFELAYELFSQPALGNSDTNTEEQALARIREEYRLLLELESPMGIVFSESVQSALLVIRSAIDNEAPHEARLQLLDQAFKLIKSNPNTTQSALILLRKIDYVISHEMKDPFVIINGLLKELFNFIKTIKTHRTLKNEYNFGYIAHEVCALIYRYLNATQENLLRFEANSLRESFKLQLAILEYYQTTLLSQPNLSSLSELIKSQCEPAIVSVKISLSIMEAIPLEEKVREDLLQKKKQQGEVHFLIPRVLLSQMRFTDTPTDQQDLFSPYSPLIGLVVGCQEMLDYEPNKEKFGRLFNDELNAIYRLVVKNVLHALDTLLPQTLLDLLKGEEKNGSCLTQLHQLTQAMNDAHLPNGQRISAEAIPLLRQVLTLYPDHPYLNFTLYKALADNTPKDTECPELVEACCKAAEAGHIFAEYRYACLLQTGNYGTEKHEAAACIYLDRSVKKNYYKAEIRLAKLHKHGLFGYEQNNKYAKMHVKRALDNPELPGHLDADLRDKYNIIFIPKQIDFE